MREHFVTQYAAGLVSHSALALTALNYAHLCPVTGRATVAMMVEHLALPTDRLATMVTIFFDVCRRCPTYR